MKKNLIHKNKFHKNIKKLISEQSLTFIEIDDTNKLIQFRPMILDSFMLAILKLALNKGFLGLEEVASKLNKGYVEVEETLEDLVSFNIAKIKRNDISGEIYYFPGINAKK